MLSFWEKQSLVQTDIAIIGGGITGLSVAASLAERFSGRSITVFERSMLPYGASTRNAGFACFGSLTEALSDIRQMGEEKAVELIYQRWKGLQITRDRLTDSRIGFLPLGGFELLEGALISALDELETVNQLVTSFLPNYVFRDDDFAQRSGLKSTSPIVGMRDEGQVNTGLLMRSLEEYVLQKGVKIRTGAQVNAISKESTWQVRVSDRERGEIEFHAEQVVVCTNAFAKQLLPETTLLPGRGQVFITKPIPGLTFQGNLHIDEGYYYLRNLHDRLLFGGARNIDFERETSYELKLNDDIQQHLEEKLAALFHPVLNVEIDMRWAGIMAFGEDKFPVVKKIEDGLHCAVKMGGMGIALAGFIGEQVAQQLDA